MDVSKYQHQATTTVALAPEVIYDMVADVTRMGEWSPVCTSCAWNDADHTHFTGTNTIPEREWSTTCRVDVAERGKEFTFTNLGMTGDAELVRWSYRFAPSGDGTEVTEVWEVLPAYGDFMAKVAPGMDVVEYLDGVKPVTQDGMATTLANLKAVAEG